MQAFLVEVPDVEKLVVGGDWLVGVRVQHQAEMLSGAGLQVGVLPEVAELGPLPSEDEDRGFRTDVPPSLRPHLSQIGQGGVQALAHDLAAPQADFVDPMRLLGIAAVTHVVDQEHPHSRASVRKVSRAHFSTRCGGAMTIPENGWPCAWTNIMPRAIRVLPAPHSATT